MTVEPLSLLARALEPSLDPPSDALSQRILDAALDLAAASGMRHLTIDDVARRARVGRMTVYRRFGDKQHLIEALAVRESRRCLGELDAAIHPGAPIEQQVAAGLLVSLRLAREHPLLNRFARFEREALLGLLLADEGMPFSAARAFVAARLRASRDAGAIGPIDADQAAELLVRLAFSFVLIQETALPLEDETHAREMVRRLVTPLLGSDAGARAPASWQ